MASNEHSTVVGVFRERSQAEKTVDELERNGFPKDQITIFGRPSSDLIGTIKGAFTNQTPTDSQDLAALTIPEDQRQFYQREIENGYFLVAIHVDGSQDKALGILNQYGAYGSPMGGDRVIPLRSEEVQVNKQVVQVGEIRVHKRIVTENKTFTVPVTREEVTIERVPITAQHSYSREDNQLADETHLTAASSTVSHPSTATSAAIEPAGEALKEEGMLRILVHEDQVSIQKRPVVIEEVRIQKRSIEEVKQFVESVRHEEANVEQVGTVRVHDTTSKDRAYNQ